MMRDGWRREAIDRTDWLEPDAAPGLRLTQLTSETVRGSSNIYMESHVFTPDGARFVFERYPETHPKYFWGMARQYWVCDLTAGGAIRPLTSALRAKGPAVSPDGQWLYYFVDTGRPGAGRVEVRRVDLDGARDEILTVIDAPIPGSLGRTLSRIYPLSTISSDGSRLATGAFLGDGVSPKGPWGVLRVDLDTLDAAIIWSGTDYCNPHPQYARSTRAADRRLLLVQHNHGSGYTAGGVLERLTGGAGTDVHVITDDGDRRWDLAMGRDGVEFCQGHQAWRGERSSVVASLWNHQESSARLVDLEPAPRALDAPHNGRLTLGAGRRALGDGRGALAACHFALDASGSHIVWDNPRDVYGRGIGKRVEQVWLAVGTIVDGAPDRLRAQRLLRPKSSFTLEQYTHPHPFFSPDATQVLFNSDRTGVPQIWMVQGYTFPHAPPPVS